LTRRATLRTAESASTKENLDHTNAPTIAMERFVPIVHAVTAVFTVIELGLTAYRKPTPISTGTTSTLTTF
jgi:hypothetical protein